ncbi:MAG: GNAT family N-acetyltransferase, partial [Candidatus Omnitrophica bacterium]|nr:GNAT family N-acetyltransferase [Candidatus Omnitrophota bacterium]
MLLSDKIQFIDLGPLQDILIEGGWFKFSVESDSMSPTLKRGDIVKVIPIVEQDIRPSDILVFKKGERLFVHRAVSLFIENGQKFVITRGDRPGAGDERILLEDIVGRVVGVERSNRKVNRWHNNLFYSIKVKLIKVLCWVQRYSLYRIIVNLVFPIRVTYWFSVKNDKRITNIIVSKSLRYSSKLIGEFKGKKDYRIFAKIVGRIIGSLGVRFDNDKGFWEIYNLYVSSLFRRRRIATRIFNIMLSILENNINKDKDIVIFISKSNLIVKEFFKKMGFNEVP